MRAVTITAAIAVCTATSAVGQQQCAPRQTVVAELKGKYGEARQSIGLVQDGTAILEIWANISTKTWTALITRADGMSCIVSAGQLFELLNETPDPAGMRL